MQEVTAQNEKEFLTVLSLLKKKDPKIYDQNVHFYENESSSEDEGETSKKPEKPIYLKDYERQQLLEKGSKAFVSDDESDDDDEEHQKDLTYNEEQKALKDSFKTVFIESSEDEIDFLSVRQKTEQQKDALQRFWNDPNLDVDEQFLRNFILDKGYMDKDDMRWV
ncbi:hypothetical protein QZH41_016854 [Actinostola sp. cb2023]|nr:hypothetical protein QZH41_016854 [Actinostola sp. cb2023]